MSSHVSYYGADIHSDCGAVCRSWAGPELPLFAWYVYINYEEERAYARAKTKYSYGFKVSERPRFVIMTTAVQQEFGPFQATRAVSGSFGANLEQCSLLELAARGLSVGCQVLVWDG